MFPRDNGQSDGEILAVQFAGAHSDLKRQATALAMTLTGLDETAKEARRVKAASAINDKNLCQLASDMAASDSQFDDATEEEFRATTSVGDILREARKARVPFKGYNINNMQPAKEIIFQVRG